MMPEFDLDAEVNPNASGVVPQLSSGFACPPTGVVVCLSPFCVPTVGCPLTR